MTDPLERIALAVERLVAGIERLNRNLERNLPLPELRIGRNDDSKIPAISQGVAGQKVFVHVVNRGAETTVLRKAKLESGDRTYPGGIKNQDESLLEQAAISPNEERVLIFDVEVDQPLARQMSLYLHHSPGRFLNGDVVVVELDSIGMIESRPSWQAINYQDRPEAGDHQP